MQKNIKMTEVFGYPCVEFTFLGRAARLIMPRGEKNGKWLLKTEYADAFPAFEKEMLSRGYHVAYVANATRWWVKEDSDVKDKFAEFLHTEYGLSEKCVPVGMSCGGLQAVHFAADYPERIAALYLDAPVMNLLSCPLHVGYVRDETFESMFLELTRTTGLDASALINYRNHPIDNVPKLLSKKIPIMLVAGDSDTVVHFSENGQILWDLYKAGGGEIEVIVKAGCDHHPHGLDDNTPIVEFVEKHYK